MQKGDDKKTSTGRSEAPASFPVIPGYRFLQTIARSANSEIHVAHAEELGHNVAVKVLRTDALSAADVQEGERFERERELLMRIKHPAIVDVYDWGVGQDFRYIVTEYFPGGSLELRIRNLMTVRDCEGVKDVQVAARDDGILTLHVAGTSAADLAPALATAIAYRGWRLLTVRETGDCFGRPSCA